MAGIGFKLQKIMRNPTLGNILRAYAYAALISSGPLILSLLSLALLGICLDTLHLAEELVLFFSSVTHIYAFTLIVTAPIQLVFVRFSADCEYTGDTTKIFPFLMTSMAVTTPLTTAAGLIFFLGFVPAPLIFQLGAAFLATLVSCVWMVSSYLTAVKSYNRVIFSFAAGYGVSFVLTWILTVCRGTHWSILGFAIGHLVLLILLLSTVFHELSHRHTAPIAFLRTFFKYKDLALTGLLYNIGIWADKALFWWFAPGHVQVAGPIYCMPVHDQGVYLGFFSIIPGMAIFLLRLETQFALQYKRYFDQAVNKASYADLQQTKQSMIQALSREIMQLIKVQGGISLLLIIFAQDLMPFLHLDALQAGVFQIVLLGSLMLMLFIVLLTVLFYLDKRHDALFCCAIFCLTNIAVTCLTIVYGEAWYGVGYVAAGALAFLLAAHRVNYHIERLEYDTFAMQPLY